MITKVVFDFDSLIGQDRASWIIRSILKKKAIPNAFLFTGKKGIGKSTVAKLISMACNCLEQEYTPCCNCKSCKKIQSGNHPDIITVEPEPSPSSPDSFSIRVDKIRDICSVIELKPFEGKFRVIIIEDAHYMNPQASNVLLKSLEEPPPSTFFILCAHSSSLLLPTIVSRCRHIRFNPIDNKKIQDFLLKNYDIDENSAFLISIMCDGSISTALEMMKNNFINFRAFFLEQLHEFNFEKIGYILSFAESVSKNKKHVAYALDILSSWIRDLIIIRYSREKIINKDIENKLISLYENEKIEGLLNKLEKILVLKRNLSSSINLRLNIESMLFNLARK
ncbi:MAG: DNA polymerase III subunit delta' [Desulfobacterales bacterium]|nr:DNA polymerase III subunit delta' [Desulfobacterales bacterium]